jgi:hypothetical protein
MVHIPTMTMGIYRNDDFTDFTTRNAGGSANKNWIDFTVPRRLWGSMG